MQAARITILVVDDEPEVRSFLKLVLRDPCYRVLEAGSGLEALAVGACHRIDLLLADIDLPGIAGPKLAEKFSHAYPAIPVIYLSDREGSPCGRVLPKPLDAEAIVREVREALGAPGKKQPSQINGVRAAAARIA